jgi:ribosomal protein S27AE
MPVVLFSATRPATTAADTHHAPRHELTDDPSVMNFTCPWCGAVSGHPDDERERYCGHCHAFPYNRFRPRRFRSREDALMT